MRASNGAFSAARSGATSHSLARSRHAGDFVSTWIGEQPVVVVRQADGSVRAFLNRCAHRGVAFCRAPSGHADELMCPYHQWTYDLDGNLLGVPFRRACRIRWAQDGRHARRLRARGPRARSRCRSPSDTAWCSRVDGVAAAVRRVPRPDDARLLRPRLRRTRARACSATCASACPANWKLMFENIKDPYHASLLHVFLVTFGLFRADNPSGHEMDETGRHSVLVSSRGEQTATEATGEMRARSARREAARPAAARPGARVPGRRDGRDADALAEPDRAAAVEHAGDAPARDPRPASSST